MRQTLTALMSVVCALPAAAQHDIDFDADWTFTRNGEVHHVTLPHAWNEDDAFRVAIDQLPTDTVRYVKTFRLDEKERDGKRFFIEFERARQAATVWLNGHRLGKHENGVTAFGFDLTPYIDRHGENRLEVLTDNSWDYREEATGTAFQWNNKNFNANYGGLTGHVRLHILSDIYQTLPLYSSFGTTGTYVYAKDIDVPGRTATVAAEAEVRNEGAADRAVRLEVEVADIDGTTVATFASAPSVVAAGATRTLVAEHPLEGLHFWSWGYGYLYTVATRLVEAGRQERVVDEVVTRTGFRKTAFGDGQFRLNDRTLMVHGYAQRSTNEWPAVGASVPAWLSDYSNALMVESGGNLVRWMHVAPWRQDVESCDRVGLLQALPAGDAEKDAEGRQWAQRVEAMRDAIVCFRNNPSVVFYECGNKGIGEAHMAEMRAVRDALDPHGGRAIGSREMLASRTAEYGGEMLYINKSAGKPVWAMEYSRDEALRRYWDDWSYPYHKNGDGPPYRNADASAYNQNQDQLAIEHVRRWHDYWAVRPGTGRRVSSGGVKIVFSDTNTHCRGESDYRASGVTDAMRLPKDSFFAHRVMWDGWVTPEASHTYILGHWNYAAGTVKPVHVVSDAPVVELLLNGRSLGMSATPDHHFLHTFDSVAFEAGELRAVSYDKQGNVRSQFRHKTAGEPAALRLSVETSPQGFVADGADMALVTFEVVDADGRRCPLDNRTVRFTLHGPAEWRGGIAKGEGNRILATSLPVECGVNRAIIRSTTQSGTVRLTAQTDGLPAAEATLVSLQPARDGKRGHRAGHPFRPLRGETPPSPSFRDTKRAVAVASVEAGCNQELAANAIDDNEETEWRNDGRAATAWISYRFERPSRVDEISLKLTGWRRRSYPIEVLADGERAWAGRTPTSLGYVSIPLNAGREVSAVTIRLQGTATESEGFGQVTELAQPVANELDLFKAKDGDKVRSELRIIETDFLQHVR